MKKFSQSEIVDATNIDKSTISRYLRGYTVPSVAVAQYIKKRTGLPIEVFTSMDKQEVYLERVYLDEDIFYSPKRRVK